MQQEWVLNNDRGEPMSSWVFEIKCAWLMGVGIITCDYLTIYIRYSNDHLVTVKGVWFCPFEVCCKEEWVCDEQYIRDKSMQQHIPAHITTFN